MQDLRQGVGDLVGDGVEESGAEKTQGCSRAEPCPEGPRASFPVPRLLITLARVPPKLRVIQVVWALVFLEGACWHAYVLAVHGLAVFDFAPAVARFYFHSLLILDPLALVMVLRRSRSGVLFGAGVMTADVAANLYTNWHALSTDPGQFLTPVGLLPITLSGLFVLATASTLWNHYPAGIGTADAAT